MSLQLNDEQLRQYWDDGFVVVPDILSTEEIEKYKARATAIARGDLPDGGEKMLVRDVRVAKGEHVPEDPEKGLWKLLQPDRYDETFRDYPLTENLLDVVEQIIGEDIKCLLTMMIYKPPGLEEVHHPFHQDKAYFRFGPADQIMGTWVALDATTADNGTMVFIPGSHESSVDHEYDGSDRQNFGIFQAQGYEAGHPDEVVVNLEPGAGVFFHPRLLHRIGPNRTEGHRRVLTMHCANCECTMDGELLGEMSMRLMRGKEYADCI